MRILKSNSTTRFTVGQRVACEVGGSFHIGFVLQSNPTSILFDSIEDEKYSTIYPVVHFLNCVKPVEFDDLILDDREPNQICHSKEDVLFGLQFLYSLWNYLNARLFDKVLPYIPIVQMVHPDIYGRYTADYDKSGKLVRGTAKMLVNTRLSRPFDLMSVLAHEMVHQYQSAIEGKVVDGPQAHDTSFFKWKPKLHEIGVDLTMYGDFEHSTYTPFKQEKPIYILIYKYGMVYNDDLERLNRLKTRLKDSWISVTQDVNIPYLIDRHQVTGKYIQELKNNRLI